MSSQLGLSFPAKQALSRADFIVAPGNEAALAFIDSWPDWPARQAAVFGPAGSGKSHLGAIWAERANAIGIDAQQLNELSVEEGRAVMVDNVDTAAPALRDATLFSLLNRPGDVLLIGRDSPAAWPVVMPDLKSRFQALLAFSVWVPDDALLAGLTVKLFADRQLRVAPAVIERIVSTLERSPAAIRDFVGRLDREALAQKRAVTPALVRELLPESA